MRQGVIVRLTSRDRRQLETIIRNPRSTRDAVRRCVVVLATADGLGTSAVMRLSGLSKPVVWRWQERYMREGVAGLAPRRAGRPPTAWDRVRRRSLHSDGIPIMGRPVYLRLLDDRLTRRVILRLDDPSARLEASDS